MRIKKIRNIVPGCQRKLLPCQRNMQTENMQAGCDRIFQPGNITARNILAWLNEYAIRVSENIEAWSEKLAGRECAEY